MSKVAAASIIVNNFNYAQFLRAAVDSALGQTYRDTEVIVVDDGSTDESRRVIAGFGDRVLPVLRSNGGQASAFHAGLRASKGDVIIFLDADDLLLPSAVERCVRHFEDPHVVKVHWPMSIVDGAGRPTGKDMPGVPGLLPEGDFRATVLRNGPDSYLTCPTSGNAWSRRFLEQVLPAPAEDDYRRGADGYLFTVTPFFGTVRAIHEPLTLYRAHGKNQYWSGSMDKRIRGSLDRFEARCRTLVGFLNERHWHADVEGWRARNTHYQWMRKMDQAFGELLSVCGPDRAIVLVDEDRCGGRNALTARRVRPFLDRGGDYWGPPADSAQAVNELERMRGEGAGHIAFAWPAFWWLDHYAGLSRHLSSCYRRVLRNERLTVFDLA